MIAWKGTTTKRKYKSVEKNQCIRFMYDLALVYPKIYKCIFHIPNGEARNAITGSILKKMGVKKGVADYFIFKPNHLKQRLWLEFKSGKGKQSLEQKEFQSMIEEIGDIYLMPTASTEALDMIKDFYKL